MSEKAKKVKVPAQCKNPVVLHFLRQIDCSKPKDEKRVGLSLLSLGLSRLSLVLSHRALLLFPLSHFAFPRRVERKCLSHSALQKVIP